MSLSIWSARLCFPQLITLLYVNQPLQLEGRHCKLRYWGRERNCWKQSNKRATFPQHGLCREKYVVISSWIGRGTEMSLCHPQSSAPRTSAIRQPSSDTCLSTEWGWTPRPSGPELYFWSVVHCSCSRALVPAFSGIPEAITEWEQTGWVPPVRQYPSLFSAQVTY